MWVVIGLPLVLIPVGVYPSRFPQGFLLIVSPLSRLSFCLSLSFFLSNIRWVSWFQQFFQLLLLSERRFHYINPCVVLCWWVIVLLCRERRILISFLLIGIWIMGRGNCVHIHRRVFFSLWGSIWASMKGMILVNPTNRILHWHGLTGVVSYML